MHDKCLIASSLIAQAHGSYAAIDGGYSTYGTLDLVGGRSTSIRDLTVKEASAFTAVASLDTTLGTPGQPAQVTVEAAAAPGGPDIEQLLEQPCFRDGVQSTTRMFLAFEEGRVMGGQLPRSSGAEFVQGWLASEYYLVEPEASTYTLGAHRGAGQLHIRLLKVRSGVLRNKIETCLEQIEHSEDEAIVLERTRELRETCGLVEPRVMAEGLLHDGALAIDASVLPRDGAAMQLYGRLEVP